MKKLRRFATLALIGLFLLVPATVALARGGPDMPMPPRGGGEGLTVFLEALVIAIALWLGGGGGEPD